MSFINDFPKANFNRVDKKDIDWREILDDGNDDSDDQEIPEDVIEILGFDPRIKQGDLGEDK